MRNTRSNVSSEGPSADRVSSDERPSLETFPTLFSLFVFQRASSSALELASKRNISQFFKIQEIPCERRS